MLKIILLTMLLFFKLLTLITPTIQSLESEKVKIPTNIPMPRSLFINDTCIAPCWYGLIPGESNAIDVENVIEREEWLDGTLVSREDYTIIDSETGNVIKGFYDIIYDVSGDLSFMRQNLTAIYLEDEVIAEIRVTPQEIVTLADVLEVYGEPDSVEFSIGSYMATDLQLYYGKYQLQIWLTESMTEICQFNNITDTLKVITVSYLSAQKMNFPVAPESIEEFRLLPTPTPKSFGSRNIYIVPHETWLSWLSSESDDYCHTANEILPLSTLVPRVTPTPLSTTPTPSK